MSQGVPGLWLGPHGQKPDKRCKRQVHGSSSPRTHLQPSPPTLPLGTTDSPFDKALHMSHREYEGKNERSLLDRDRSTVNVCWPALFPKKKFQRKQPDQSCTAYADFAIKQGQDPWSGKVLKAKQGSEFIIPQGIRAPVESTPKVVTPRVLYHPRGRQEEDLSNTVKSQLASTAGSPRNGSPTSSPVGLALLPDQLASLGGTLNTMPSATPRQMSASTTTTNGGRGGGRSAVPPIQLMPSVLSATTTSGVGGYGSSVKAPPLSPRTPQQQQQQQYSPRQGTPRTRQGGTPRSKLTTPKAPMTMKSTLSSSHSVLTGGLQQGDFQSAHNSKLRALTKQLPTYSTITSIYAKAQGEAIELDEATDKLRQAEFEKEMISSQAAMKAIGDFECMHFVEDRHLKASVMRDRHLGK